MSTKSEEIQVIELNAEESSAFGSLMTDNYKEPEAPVEEEVVETIDEDARLEEPEVETKEPEAQAEPEVVEDVEETEVIEDRFLGIPKKEDVVAPKAEDVKKEEKIEPQKVTITVPFKSEVDKIIYNALQDNKDANRKGIESLYEKSYEKLSDLEVIKYSIATDPKYANISSATLDRFVNKKLAELQSDLDLDDPTDLGIFNEMVGVEANQIKNQLSKRREELISKYSADVNIEVDAPQQTEVQPEPTAEELAAIRDGYIAEALAKVNAELTEDFVTIDDKEGPIRIPIQDKAKVAEAIVDPVKFMTEVAMVDGKFDMKKFAKWVNYGLNMNVHDNEAIKSGIAMGKKSVVREIKSQKSVNPRESTSVGNKNPLENLNEFAQAMANAKFN